MLEFVSVPIHPPFLQIHHHHPRVEIARGAVLKSVGKERVGPESGSEIMGEIGMAVFWCA